MATLQKPSHVDISELKSILQNRLGAPKTKVYFRYLELFLQTRLTKTEFTKLVLATIGRENIPLHNKLISSVLKNGLNGFGGPNPKVKETNGSSPPNRKENDVMESGVNNSGPIDPKGKEVLNDDFYGSGLDPKEKGKEVSDDVFNASDLDPKEKGTAKRGPNGLDWDMEEEDYLNDILSGLESDQKEEEVQPKTDISGKTPSGHFGDALNSPPVKNDDNNSNNDNNNDNNNNNICLGKRVEERGEPGQNANLMGTDAEIGNILRAAMESCPSSSTAVDQIRLNSINNVWRAEPQNGLNAINPISNPPRVGQQSSNQFTAPIGLPNPLRKRPRSSFDSESCRNIRELPDTHSLFTRLSKRLKEQGMDLTLSAANAINHGLNAHLMQAIMLRTGYPNPNWAVNPNSRSNRVEVIEISDDEDEEHATSHQSMYPSFANPNLSKNPGFAYVHSNFNLGQISNLMINHSMNKFVGGSCSISGSGNPNLMMDPSTSGGSRPNPNLVQNPDNITDLDPVRPENETNPNSTSNIFPGMQKNQGQFTPNGKSWQEWFDEL